MTDASGRRWTDQVAQTFLAGVLGLLPLSLTIAVLYWVVDFLHDRVGPRSGIGRFLQKVGMAVSACEITAYVLGLIGTVLLIYGFGILLERGFGRRWQGALDGAVHRIPLISTVYDASKNLTSMFARRDDSLQGMTPVLCYFGEGLGVSTPALMPTPDLVYVAEQPYHVVMVPTAPVPFGGALFLVRAEWVKPANVTFDELVGIYMSMGLSAPGCFQQGESKAN